MFGFHPKTSLAVAGKIYFILSVRAHAFYSLDELVAHGEDIQKVVLSVRVSTAAQKDDLQNQLD